MGNDKGAKDAKTKQSYRLSNIPTWACLALLSVSGLIVLCLTLVLSGLEG